MTPLSRLPSPRSPKKDTAEIPAALIVSFRKSQAPLRKEPDAIRQLSTWIAERISQTVLSGKDGSMHLLALNRQRLETQFGSEQVTKAQQDALCWLGVDEWEEPLMDTVTFNHFCCPLKGAGVDEVEHDLEWRWRYAVKYLDRWTFWWTYIPARRTTVIMMDVSVERCWFGVEDLVTIIRESTALYSNPVSAGLFISALIKQRLKYLVNRNAQEISHQQLSSRIPNVESVGNPPAHELDDTRPATQPFMKDIRDPEISAREQTKKVMASAMMMNRYEGVTVGVLELLDYLKEENNRFQEFLGDDTDKPSVSVNEYMQRKLRLMTSEIRGVKRVAKRWGDQASLLIQGEHNLISQAEQRNSVNLARESRSIAAAAWEDNRELKVLTWIALLFLPGAFFAVSSFPYSVLNSFNFYYLCTRAVLIIFSSDPVPNPICRQLDEWKGPAFPGNHLWQPHGGHDADHCHFPLLLDLVCQAWGRRLET